MDSFSDHHSKNGCKQHDEKHCCADMQKAESRKEEKHKERNIGKLQGAKLHCQISLKSAFLYQLKVTVTWLGDKTTLCALKMLKAAFLKSQTCQFRFCPLQTCFARNVAKYSDKDVKLVTVGWLVNCAQLSGWVCRSTLDHNREKGTAAGFQTFTQVDMIGVTSADTSV